MILFVQGPSHSGKSTMARAIARRTGASVFSLDLLKMGLLRSGNADFAGLTPLDDAEIEVRLWPIVREAARTARENGQSVVFEGAYLPFAEVSAWIRSLPKTGAPEDGVTAAAIAFTPDYVEQHYEAIASHADSAERRIGQSTPAVSKLLADHREVRRKAAAHGWILIEVDSPDDWTKKVEGLGGLPAGVWKALRPG